MHWKLGSSCSWKCSLDHYIIIIYVMTHQKCHITQISHYQLILIHMFAFIILYLTLYVASKCLYFPTIFKISDLVGRLHYFRLVDHNKSPSFCINWVNWQRNRISYTQNGSYSLLCDSLPVWPLFIIWNNAGEHTETKMNCAECYL